MTDVLRDEATTARDKLHAAAGYITHALDAECPMADAIDAADRLLDVVAGHLASAKAALSTEETHEHGV